MKYLNRLRLKAGQYAWTSGSIVKRGGKQHWSGQTKDVYITTWDRGGQNRAITVMFAIPSKGGGNTDIEARIGPADFSSVLQAMIAADRDAAIEAMYGELAYELGCDGEADEKKVA